MKKYIIHILLCLIAVTLTETVQAQNNQCSALIDNIIKKYDKSNGISAKFTTTTTGNGFSSKMGGNILMSGDKFYLNSEEIECGYDGKTLWSFIKNNGEINLSTPDSDELSNINPYLLLKNYSTRFKCTYKDKSSINETLLLEPKNSNDNIKQVEVVVNSNILYPSEINIYNRDNSQISISISEYKNDSNIDKSKFSFNEQQYPNIEVIDLR